MGNFCGLVPPAIQPLNMRAGREDCQNESGRPDAISNASAEPDSSDAMPISAQKQSKDTDGSVDDQIGRRQIVNRMLRLGCHVIRIPELAIANFLVAS